MTRQLAAVVPGAVWTAHQPLTFYGLHITTCMSVVRLGDGRLWVHSPIDLDEAGRAELDARGEVAAIVAPSRMHHLFLEPFRAHYPKARVFGSDRLVEQHKEIPFRPLAADHPEPEWAADLDQARVEGHNYLDEVVFLHRASRTLILCDLLESVHADSPFFQRFIGRLAGMYEHPRPPPDMRLGFKDRPAARAFVERVLGWDFDRIVIAHGHLIASGGKDVFRSAFGFLFEGPPTASEEARNT